LEVLALEPGKFNSPEPTAEQQSQNGPVALSPNRLCGRALQQLFGLFDGQPIANPHAKVLRAIHSANARSKFWTQQARVSGLVRKRPDGGHPLTPG